MQRPYPGYFFPWISSQFVVPDTGIVARVLAGGARNTLATPERAQADFPSRGIVAFSPISTRPVHFDGSAFGVAFREAFGAGRAGCTKKRLKQPNRSSSSFRNLQSATAFAIGGFG